MNERQQIYTTEMKRGILGVLTTNKTSCWDTPKVLGNKEQNETTHKEMPAFTSFVKK